MFRFVSFLFIFFFRLFRAHLIGCRSLPHLTDCPLQVLGDFIGSVPDMRRILNGMREGAFAEGAYDVVRKNCNNFCDEFVFALVGKRIPSWVNRAATLGTWAGLGEVRTRCSPAAASRPCPFLSVQAYSGTKHHQ